MKDRLEGMKNRYEQINQMLSDVSIVSDIKKLKELSKEQRQLEKVVTRYQDLLNAEKELQDLKTLVKDEDPDIRDMAQDELEKCLAKIEKIEQELKILLIPKDPNDEKDVIIEIQGAAGGDEANIFAGDLYRMYMKYIESKGWRAELLDAQVSEAGGFSYISFSVTGDSVYSFLKYESGSHRVQRVPATESQGRIHTSTATVLVMPEADEIEVNLDMNDVRIDTFCSSGPGGQSVNTTKSAADYPYSDRNCGFVPRRQEPARKQSQRFESIAGPFYERMLAEREAKEGQERLSKVGQRTFEKSELTIILKTVTDHRIGFTIQQLDRVMEGKLDPIIEALIAHDQEQALKGSAE